MHACIYSFIRNPSKIQEEEVAVVAAVEAVENEEREMLRFGCFPAVEAPEISKY